MRRIPNFVLLRAFEAAARLQGFSLAAQELHLTPSAISHQVRELEEVFGRALFVRSHRRVDLTAEGKRLAEGLGRVLDALEACCSEVALSPSGEVLSLYCAPSFAVKWLGPRLPLFMAANPGITIRLSSGAEPLDLRQAREIDVSITYGQALQRPGVEVLALGQERIAPLCSPMLKPPGRSWKQLMPELTLIDSSLSQVTWRDWFSLNGLALPARPRPSFDRAALSISAAADGMGVALESVRLAERELLRGELVEVGPAPFRPVRREMHFFSCRSTEQQLPRIRTFRDWLLEQLNQSDLAGRKRRSTAAGARPRKTAAHSGGQRPAR